MSGSKVGVYCKEYVEDGMMRVGHERCAQQDRSKWHRFRVRNTKVGVYRKEHAGDGMVHVVNERCRAAGLH